MHKSAIFHLYTISIRISAFTLWIILGLPIVPKRMKLCCTKATDRSDEKAALIQRCKSFHVKLFQKYMLDLYRFNRTQFPTGLPIARIKINFGMVHQFNRKRFKWSQRQTGTGCRSTHRPTGQARGGEDGDTEGGFGGEGEWSRMPR